MYSSLVSGEVGMEKVNHLQRYPVSSLVAGQSSLSYDNSHKKKVVKWFKPSYPWRWFGNRGIGIVLFWSLTVFSIFGFYLNLFQKLDSYYRYYYFVIIIIGSVLFPLVGLLTDVYFGRYRVIKACLIVMWVGAILLCLLTSLTVYLSSVALYMRICLGVVIGLGFGVFQVNIVQFSMDQLLDSSSNEIISFITWYVWTYFAARAIFDLMLCVGYYQHVFAMLVLCLLLTLAVASDFLFNHWLVKEPVTHNPLKLIFKVLRYAMQNKYPRQRSAFANWDDRRFSRIDLGKNKYGGPFTTEQVEDVKTFFRMYYLLWVGCLFVGVTAYSGSYISAFLSKFLHYCWIKKTITEMNIGECVKGTYVIFFGRHLVVLCIPLYEFVLVPVFRRCLLRTKIFSQMVVGAVVVIAYLVGLMSVEVAGRLKSGDLHGNTTFCMNYSAGNDCDSPHDIPYHWLAVQMMFSFMYVVGVYLLIAAGMTFVSAQAPYSMKGLIFGSVYSIMGVALVFLQVLFILFRQTVISVGGVVMGCVFWFLLTCVVLSVVLTVVFVMVSHCYKNRQRDHEGEDTDQIIA